MAFESPKSVKVVKLILAASSIFIPFALLEHSFSDNHRFIIHFIPLAAKSRSESMKLSSVRMHLWMISPCRHRKFQTSLASCWHYSRSAIAKAYYSSLIFLRWAAIRSRKGERKLNIKAKKLQFSFYNNIFFLLLPQFLKTCHEKWWRSLAQHKLRYPKKHAERGAQRSDEKWCLAVWNEMKLLNYNKNE